MFSEVDGRWGWTMEMKGAGGFRSLEEAAKHFAETNES